MKIIVLAIVSLYSALLSAETGSWTKVSRIYTPTNGINIFVELGKDSMPGCYNNNGAYLKGENIDRIYSTILAAKMADKSIRPYFDIVGSDQNAWSRCNIAAIYIE